MPLTETYKRHLTAIGADAVTKTNIIGLRKVFNHQARIDNGLSGNRCNVTSKEAEALESALAEHQPRVVGELHDSGIKLLQSRRYRNRFNEYVTSIINQIDCFRLIGFEFIDNYHTVPVYRVIGKDGRKFKFRNVPWQSGGDGPEVLS